MFNYSSILDYCLNTFKLGGTRNIIEIDESKFGRRKYSRGHHVGGVWVFGGVERRTKKIFLISVEKRNKETLENILKAQINFYSIIYSDCWKAYNNLKNIFFAHKTVNHSKEFMNKKENVHTNTIEGTWNAIKRNIPFRNRTKKLVTIYLLRFMLCRNNENSELSELLYCSLSYKY